MAIDNTVMICIGVAGAVLVVYSMADANKGTPEEEEAKRLDRDMRDGKNELTRLETKYKGLLEGEDGGDLKVWKLEKFAALHDEIYHCEDSMDRVWQLRAVAEPFLERLGDEEETDFHSRVDLLRFSVEEILDEARGRAEPIRQHNTLHVSQSFRTEPVYNSFNVTQNVARDERQVNVEMGGVRPDEFNSLGDEGARRQDLQESMRLQDSAGTTNNVPEGGFMSIADNPANATAEANDQSAMVVDDGDKNLPGAPTAVVARVDPKPKGKEARGTFNNARKPKQDNPVQAAPRVPASAPPNSRQNVIVLDAAANTANAPNFRAAPGEGSGDTDFAGLEAKVDSLKRQLERQQNARDKRGAAETQTQIKDIMQKLKSAPKSAVVLKYGETIRGIRAKITAYTLEKHTVEREVKVRTHWNSLMEMAPDRLPTDQTDVGSWDMVFSLAKSDMNTIELLWGTKLRTAFQAGLGDGERQAPAKKKKTKPTANPAPLKIDVDLTKPLPGVAPEFGQQSAAQLIAPFPDTPTSAIEEEDAGRKRSSTLTERPPNVPKVDDLAKKGAITRNRLLYV